MYQDSFGSALKRGYMSIPVVIRVLITINVVIYILMALGGPGFYRLMVELFGFDPDWRVAATQPWRVVTYMFLHAHTFHLLFNMLWLWWMGRAVEETLGPRTFLVIYFGAGIGGVLVNMVFAFFSGYNLVIGASGAVLGVMVAFAYMFPRTPIMLLLLPPIEARFIVAGLIAIDVIFIGAGDNVARLVHLGGAAFGYLLTSAHYKGTDLSAIIRTLENLKPGKRKAKPKRQRNKNMYSIKDVEIMEENDADELDEILDKISKEGYDALSAEEKKKLFELSKRN